MAGRCRDRQFAPDQLKGKTSEIGQKYNVCGFQDAGNDYWDASI
ncbi:hypothetical protein ATL17_2493 [Maritalea mobilis]|uniref:Uncharacterized protein n=1 Tax=Maritalea mobilis TaxID=483324 RepID=A0A4V3DB06_9HYPH|nr:hypothetical protein ATL17_2493 [Maritalea mobilis]